MSDFVFTANAVGGLGLCLAVVEGAGIGRLAMMVVDCLGIGGVDKDEIG